MKAKFLVLLLGAANITFCAQAAENNAPAAAYEETKPADTTKKVSVPANGQVTRAIFTSDIKNHEPTDDIATLSNDKTHIAYFTEIQGMAGQTVTHRWEYNGKLMFEMPFQVGASRWRVYSTKTLNPAWTGEWKASVVDAAGGSLSVNTFSYTKKMDVNSAATPSVAPTISSLPGKQP